MSLGEAFQAFQQEVELELLTTTKDVVKRISLDVSRGIEIQYDDFFSDLLELIESRMDWVPKILRKYTPNGEWDDISTRWSGVKQKRLGMGAGNNWYYKGISSSNTTSKALSIRKKGDGGVERVDGRQKRSSKRVKTSPFAKYIATLQNSTTTEKFFGPITLQYDFQAPSIGHKITPVMGSKTVNGETFNNIITKINRRTHRGTFGKIEGDLSVTAKIEAFSFLNRIQQNEWFIVDYILKRIDPANEKQWVKINGRRGPGKSGTKRGSEGRPIRPILVPMIQFYIQEALPIAMLKYAR